MTNPSSSTEDLSIYSGTGHSEQMDHEEPEAQHRERCSQQPCNQVAHRLTSFLWTRVNVSRATRLVDVLFRHESRVASHRTLGNFDHGAVLVTRYNCHRGLVIDGQGGKVLTHRAGHSFDSALLLHPRNFEVGLFVGIQRYGMFVAGCDEFVRND